jgi:hypothetical protein
VSRTALELMTILGYYSNINGKTVRASWDEGDMIYEEKSQILIQTLQYAQTRVTKVAEQKRLVETRANDVCYRRKATGLRVS